MQYTGIQNGESGSANAAEPFVPTYDADGNQTRVKTSSGIWQVSYNAENRPVQFDNAESNTSVTCIYDSMGRRCEKTVEENGIVTSRKLYLYRGYLQIAELDATNANESTPPVLRKTYLWDPSEPVATRVLAMTCFDEVGTYVEDLYYTHDALKNTTALFGILGGRRASYSYGAYGQTLSMDGNAAADNPFRFSSEYFDEELGMISYNFRHYNPQDGRWITRDPIGEEGGLNVYGFVGNLPIFLNDQLGLLCDKNHVGEYSNLKFKLKIKGLVIAIDVEDPASTISGLLEGAIKSGSETFIEDVVEKVSEFGNLALSGIKTTANNMAKVLTKDFHIVKIVMTGYITRCCCYEKEDKTEYAEKRLSGIGTTDVGSGTHDLEYLSSYLITTMQSLAEDLKSQPC